MSGEKKLHLTAAHNFSCAGTAMRSTSKSDTIMRGTKNDARIESIWAAHNKDIHLPVDRHQKHQNTMKFISRIYFFYSCDFIPSVLIHTVAISTSTVYGCIRIGSNFQIDRTCENDAGWGGAWFESFLHSNKQWNLRYDEFWILRYDIQIRWSNFNKYELEIGRCLALHRTSFVATEQLFF